MRVEMIVSLIVGGPLWMVVGTKQLVRTTQTSLTAMESTVGVAGKTVSVTMKIQSVTKQTVWMKKPIVTAMKSTCGEAEQLVVDPMCNV